MGCRTAVALCCVLGCKPSNEQDRAQPAEAKNARGVVSGRDDAGVHLRDSHYKLIYAARSDDAVGNTNPTYFSIHEDEALFVVVDAGLFTTSRSIGELIPKAAAGKCHSTPDGEAQLRCITEEAGMHETTALALAIVRGDQALFVRAGDAAIVWRHGDELDLLTGPEPNLGATDWTFQPRTLALGRGDWLLLANRELSATLGRTGLLAATRDTTVTRDSLETTINTLGKDAAAANPAVAHTVIAVYFDRANDITP